MNDLTELPESETQLAEKRMDAVERQIHAPLAAGLTRRILCPYCLHWNFPHRKFCCELMRKAVVTVLMADRMLRQAEIAERAASN